MSTRSIDHVLGRWRLLLGEAAAPACGALDDQGAAMDTAMTWLYERDGARAARDLDKQRGAGRAASELSVPEWIESIHQLFPRETIELLERDAVERFHIDEVVTNPEVLARVAPSEELLCAVLRVKRLMNGRVLAMARTLIEDVVRRLREKLERRLRVARAGARDRRRRASHRRGRNLDPKRTLRDNLAHYDPATRRVTVRRPAFAARVARHVRPWQLILLVDQSGSMVRSVIHSAITAACLAGVPSLRLHLVTFDTKVVDLTGEGIDPVEVLLRVQLGGGTDIGGALAYATSLVESPRRAIVVLISDFFEGSNREALVARTRALTAQGTTVLGLAALDERAEPAYDRELASRLVAAGASVGAMTPGELVGWVAAKIRD